MAKHDQQKHERPYPTARGIRRSCNKELYRTIKRLKIWVPPAQLLEAEQLYYKKVALNLPFIVENGSNRKVLADWWEENVCEEIAKLWNVEPKDLAEAFREAFGG